MSRSGKRLAWVRLHGRSTRFVLATVNVKPAGTLVIKHRSGASVAWDAVVLP